MSANRLVAVLLVAVVVLSACTDEPLATIPQGTASPPTTALPTPTTQSVPSTTTTTPQVDTVSVVEAWDGYWQAWAQTRSTLTPLDRTALDALASAEVVDRAIAAFELERGQADSPGVVTTAKTGGFIIDNSDPQKIVVEDCVLQTPPSIVIDFPAGTHFKGTLAPTEQGGWVLVELQFMGSHCIPADLNQTVIDGYLAYTEAFDTVWNPADPNHPLLEATMTGDQLARMQGLLVEYSDVIVRRVAENHPEVISIDGETAIVLNCNLPDVAFHGSFDTEGNRTELVSEPTAGLRSVISADMVLVDSVWKVTETQSQTDIGCEFAPTALGLVVVGEASP